MVATMKRARPRRMRSEPSGKYSPVSITRRSLSWDAGLRSPISSRKRVPSLRLVDEALEVGIGSGIGPLPVAEEEVGEKSVVEAGRVDRDELALAARELVDRAREKLLADAGLARDEDRVGAPGYRFGVSHELEHARIGRRDRREGGVPLRRGREQPLLDRLVLAKQLLVLDDALRGGDEALALDGLDQVVGGARRACTRPPSRRRGCR